MTFEMYNALVARTVKYGGCSLERLTYTTIALGGEVGEYQNEFKKWLRERPSIDAIPSDEQRMNLLLELGDTLWYLTRITCELGSSLKEVAQLNIDKLEGRYKNVL